MKQSPILTALNGKHASAYCYGTMQFGGTADKTASEAMFNACLEAGLNFFDTAHVYTGGTSEKMLGSFARARRDGLIIATKAAYTGGSGSQNILDQFDISQQRLGMDTVDILYLHRWDEETPLQDTFEALKTLQDSGKIRYIGVSNFAAWQVMKAARVAAQMDTRIDILQPMYSLVKRQAEVEILPMAASESIAVASYSPLGSGLLTGKYQDGGTGRLSIDTRYAARYGQDWMQETAQRLADYAAQKDISPATLAVAWAAKHPAVTAPIISARNLEQLMPSLAAMTFDMTQDVYDVIEGFSPRPVPATDRLEEA